MPDNGEPGKHRREVVSIDRRTGEVRIRQYDASPMPLAQRTAELEADALAALPGPPIAQTARLLCDVCGAMVELPRPVRAMPPGWRSDERGDVCPRCANAR